MNWIRGDTNRIEITVTEAGAVVSLVDATIKAVIASTIGGTPIVSKDTADFTVVDNVATCVLATADTATMTPGVYWVEVEVTDALGNRMSAQERIAIEGDTV